ncbi:monooxygenase [Mycobacteroides abscessus subsp. massiliense]|nr:monooxygenase [Mycobacteroides abscessus subsp. massiliense]
MSAPFRWALRRVPGAQQATRLASQAFVEATFPIPAHYDRILRVRPLAEKLGRAYLRSQVHDPEVRAKLTPQYGLGCKRPSFHNGYLATFNRPNVLLETASITEIGADAVHTSDGAQHRLDVLILATGFKVMDPENMPTYELRGVGGLSLREKWSNERLQAYEGVSVPQFPNHFNIFGPYGYNGSSYFALIEAQTAHIIRVLSHARKVGAERVEVTQEANDRFSSTRTAMCRCARPPRWNRPSAVGDSTWMTTRSAGGHAHRPSRQRGARTALPRRMRT